MSDHLIRRRKMENKSGRLVFISKGKRSYRSFHALIIFMKEILKEMRLPNPRAGSGLVLFNRRRLRMSCAHPWQRSYVAFRALWLPPRDQYTCSPPVGRIVASVARHCFTRLRPLTPIYRHLSVSVWSGSAASVRAAADRKETPGPIEPIKCVTSWVRYCTMIC